jgi:CRP/FNR family transcriptional regulator, anaerobic regulatory protein
MFACSECEVARSGKLFCFAEPDLGRLESGKRQFKIKKNQVLCTMDQPLNGWYCIRNGLIRLYKVSKSGKEQTYRILSSGDWIGHRELMKGDESLFNAVALNDGEVCFFPSVLWSFAMSNNTVSSRITESLLNDLYQAEEMIFSLGTKKLHSRLAALLTDLTEKEGRVTIPLTREVLGTILGVTTESVVRALTDFKDRNWIEVQRSAIHILNAKALREII